MVIDAKMVPVYNLSVAVSTELAVQRMLVWKQRKLFSKKVYGYFSQIYKHFVKMCHTSEEKIWKTQKIRSVVILSNMEVPF